MTPDGAARRLIDMSARLMRLRAVPRGVLARLVRRAGACMQVHPGEPPGWLDQDGTDDTDQQAQTGPRADTAGPGTAGPDTAGPDTAGPDRLQGRARVVLGSVVERYAAARAATAVLTGARGADAPTDAAQRHELLVGALVALVDSVGDVPVLLGELRAARMRAADLAAAGRATLSADQDGEADPLSYLRDELSYQAGDAVDVAGTVDVAGDVAVRP